LAAVWHPHLSLSERLGKGLNELMGWAGLITHRQFLAWQEWLAQDLDRPSRSDHYLMQAAAEARRCWVKEPNKVRIEDMRLEFKANAQPTKVQDDPDVEGPRPLTRQQVDKARVAINRARWEGKVG
jgi:hypothetical protein